jgi:putative ABC transport system permease protein
MIGTRWRKLWRDLRTERGRILLMVTAIAVSLIGIGAVLGAYAILTREMPRNYLGTRPASAALELGSEIEPALVEAVRRRPGIADAEAGEIVLARARVGDDWKPLLLFVVNDFRAMRLNTFTREEGAWPPPDGTLLIERSALPVLGVKSGERITIKTPHGTARPMLVTGLVHDPGLAPAWQENEGYGYITRATLATLGEPAELRELRVSVSRKPLELQSVEAEVTDLANWLKRQGRPVLQARVPPPGRHPHQTQMMGVLFLMLTASAMALVLSAILVATAISAMLARQVREIGVMKTIGARSAQIATLYVVLITSLGLAAVIVALPAGVVGARSLASMSANMLNLTLASQAIPWWVFSIQALAGVVVPLLAASVAVARGARITVREAIDQHGAAQPANTKAWTSASSSRTNRSLSLVLRNTFRRRTRFALTLGLLAAGGAMFMTSLNISRGWEQIIDRIHQNRFYDVDIRLTGAGAVAEHLRRVDGVRRVEAWGYSRTALFKADRVDIVRTYPDGSHGSLLLLGPPATTEFVRFPLLAGRWLLPSDTDAVVVNHLVLAQVPGLRLGDPLTLSVAGRPAAFRVVGIVEEVGSPGAAYVTDTAFASAVGTTAGMRLLRVATTAASAQGRNAVIRELEQELARVNAGVEAVIPLSVLRTAMGDHIIVLIRMLLAMAALMVTVGMLGLASTMGTNVLERTREIGVMKAIGATPRQVARLVVGEALVIGVLSWVAALFLAVPLTAMIGDTVGKLAFRLRLPFVFDGVAVTAWLILVVLVAVLATLLPARRASRLSVSEALAQV